MRLLLLLADRNAVVHYARLNEALGVSVLMSGILVREP
jgi:hypothetical protein